MSPHPSRPLALLPRSSIVVAVLLAAPSVARADQTLTFDGTVEAGGLEHVFVPFDVPDGVREIAITHDNLSPMDTLDWGLDAPSGFRGWGGGNKEPVVVGEQAASRSYLAGPIQKGTWRLVIGKAQILDGKASYHVTVQLRDAPTLAPQAERTPYVASAALASEARWYAGDFHAHTRESGDAKPTIDDFATFARSVGLDFVELSDHNTVSQLDFVTGVQKKHPDLLLVPGVEFTTYAGHANGIGATSWVDHRIGQPGVTIGGAAAQFRAQGALFSINHPQYDLGTACIGCSWAHELPSDAVDAVEIATAGAGALFGKATLAFWDQLCATGRHVAAVGGSDDHTAGQSEGAASTPIGTPTTYVFAKRLDVASLLDGVRSGRTVVKVRGPKDPFVETSSDAGLTGDTTRTGAGATTLRAKITGGDGTTARWVKNGAPLDDVDVTSDAFELALPVSPPATGQDRYRVEVRRSGQLATVTSHVWVERDPSAVAPPGASDGDAEGGGCALASGSASGAGWLAGLGALVAARRARRRRSLSGGGAGPAPQKHEGRSPRERTAASVQLVTTITWSRA